jgi:hypothetical protein
VEVNFLNPNINSKGDMPRWLSLVEQRFRKPSVAGSKPARGFNVSALFRGVLQVGQIVDNVDAGRCQVRLLAQRDFSAQT